MQGHAHLVLLVDRWHSEEEDVSWRTQREDMSGKPEFSSPHTHCAICDCEHAAKSVTCLSGRGGIKATLLNLQNYSAFM